MKTLLILGGSGAARRWAGSLANLLEQHLVSARLVYALAGVTSSPHLPQQSIEARIGGFGGWHGLKRWLEENNAVAVVDGTHPFAHKISANARLATRALSLPLFCLTQKPFPRSFSERRFEVRSQGDLQGDLQRAFSRLSSAQRRRVVFALGARRVVELARRAPVRSLLLRSFANPETIRSLRLRQLRLRRARVVGFCSMGSSAGSSVGSLMGKFSAQSTRMEARWLRAKRVSLLVCRDSGARESYAKVLAANLLSIPTLMITRQRSPRASASASSEALAQGGAIDLQRSFAPVIELLR